MNETHTVSEVQSDESETDAGRTRGRRRRGPKTAQGRAKVRMNAVRHGLCTGSPVIEDIESPGKWKRHLAALVEVLAPVGYLEQLQVERVASILWRLRRVAPAEATEIGDATVCHGVSFIGGEESCKGLPRHQGIEKVVRYEAHLARQLLHALHELQALQAMRRGRCCATGAARSQWRPHSRALEAWHPDDRPCPTYSRGHRNGSSGGADSATGGVEGSGISDGCRKRSKCWPSRESYGWRRPVVPRTVQKCKTDISLGSNGWGPAAPW